MTACKVGCIGCKMCERVCESGAVTVENNIAHIDQSKCTGCGACAEKMSEEDITGKKGYCLIGSNFIIVEMQMLP